MEIAGLSTAEAGTEHRKYVMKPSLEIFPLDSSSVEPTYVVKTAEGKSYVVSEKLRNLLLLFDGRRTLSDIAKIVSNQQETQVSGEQMNNVLAAYIDRFGLIEEVREGPLSAPDEAPHRVSTRGKTKPFDFIFRLPLIPARVAAPVVDRLTWLFTPRTAVVGVAAIVLAHVAFYQNWLVSRPAISFSSTDFLIFYALGLGTALFHELGHASACRAFRCEHGPIGLLLYIIFPAFYVNLSNAWRLRGKQRAVIDVGGIYFQLLTVIPLLLLFALTGRPYFCGVIYAVDWMVLFSLNPMFKFDGYWLLVDLTGIINLQRRGWRVVKEILSWSLGSGKGVPTLNEVAGAGRRLLLVMYAFITVSMFTALILLLVTFLPRRVVMLAGNLHQIAIGSENGIGAMLPIIGRVILNLFFFLFIYRLFSNTVFKLFKKATWKKS
jgi:hypothetical protein